MVINRIMKFSFVFLIVTTTVGVYAADVQDLSPNPQAANDATVQQNNWGKPFNDFRDFVTKKYREVKDRNEQRKMEREKELKRQQDEQKTAIDRQKKKEEANHKLFEVLDGNANPTTASEDSSNAANKPEEAGDKQGNGVLKTLRDGFVSLVKRGADAEERWYAGIKRARIERAEKEQQITEALEIQQGEVALEEARQEQTAREEQRRMLEAPAAKRVRESSRPRGFGYMQPSQATLQKQEEMELKAREEKANENSKQDASSSADNSKKEEGQTEKGLSTQAREFFEALPTKMQDFWDRCMNMSYEQRYMVEEYAKMTPEEQKEAVELLTTFVEGCREEEGQEGSVEQSKEDTAPANATNDYEYKKRQQAEQQERDRLNAKNSEASVNAEKAVDKLSYNMDELEAEYAKQNKQQIVIDRTWQQQSEEDITPDSKARKTNTETNDSVGTNGYDQYQAAKLQKRKARWDAAEAEYKEWMQNEENPLTILEGQMLDESLVDAKKKETIQWYDLMGHYRAHQQRKEAAKNKETADWLEREKQIAEVSRREREGAEIAASGNGQEQPDSSANGDLDTLHNLFYVEEGTPKDADSIDQKTANIQDSPGTQNQPAAGFLSTMLPRTAKVTPAILLLGATSGAIYLKWDSEQGKYMRESVMPYVAHAHKSGKQAAESVHQKIEPFIARAYADACKAGSQLVVIMKDAQEICGIYAVKVSELMGPAAQIAAQKSKQALQIVREHLEVASIFGKRYLLKSGQSLRDAARVVGQKGKQGLQGIGKHSIRISRALQNGVYNGTAAVYRTSSPVVRATGALLKDNKWKGLFVTLLLAGYPTMNSQAAANFMAAMKAYVGMSEAVVI